MGHSANRANRHGEPINRGLLDPLMGKDQHLIAVIDDDRNLLKALGRLLSVSGYQVEAFDSAAAFLSGAAMHKAACAIIDCQLGLDSGVELAQHIFAVGCDLPIIFMTASDSEAIRQSALEAGCIAFLRKPLLADNLLDCVSQALQSSMETVSATQH